MHNWRMWKTISRFCVCSLLITMVVVIAGCGSPITTIEVPGTYLMVFNDEYGSYEDILVLMSDGTVHQTLKPSTGKPLTATGTWQMKDKYTIEMSDILVYEVGSEYRRNPIIGEMTASIYEIRGRVFISYNYNLLLRYEKIK